MFSGKRDDVELTKRLATPHGAVVRHLGAVAATEVVEQISAVLIERDASMPPEMVRDASTIELAGAIRLSKNTRTTIAVRPPITADQVPGKRSPGSLSWGGINNTFFWIDPARGIGGVIMMQYLPFADAKALGVYDVFERGAYQLVKAEH